jgi:hypothetical protein
MVGYVVGKVGKVQGHVSKVLSKVGKVVGNVGRLLGSFWFSVKCKDILQGKVGSLIFR